MVNSYRAMILGRNFLSRVFRVNSAAGLALFIFGVAYLLTGRGNRLNRHGVVMSCCGDNIVFICVFAYRAGVCCKAVLGAGGVGYNRVVCMTVCRNFHGRKLLAGFGVNRLAAVFAKLISLGSLFGAGRLYLFVSYSVSDMLFSCRNCNGYCTLAVFTVLILVITFVNLVTVVLAGRVNS